MSFIITQCPRKVETWSEETTWRLEMRASAENVVTYVLTKDGTPQVFARESKYTEAFWQEAFWRPSLVEFFRGGECNCSNADCYGELIERIKWIEKTYHEEEEIF